MMRKFMRVSRKQVGTKEKERETRIVRQSRGKWYNLDEFFVSSCSFCKNRQSTYINFVFVVSIFNIIQQCGFVQEHHFTCRNKKRQTYNSTQCHIQAPRYEILNIYSRKYLSKCLSRGNFILVTYFSFGI